MDKPDSTPRNSSILDHKASTYPDNVAHHSARTALALAITAIARAQVSLSDANKESRVLQRRVEALIATGETGVLGEILIEMALVDRDIAVERAETAGIEGGIYGPNGTPEMQSRWSNLCERRRGPEDKLRAIGAELLAARERAPRSTDPSPHANGGALNDTQRGIS